MLAYETCLRGPLSMLAFVSLGPGSCQLESRFTTLGPSPGERTQLIACMCCMCVSLVRERTQDPRGNKTCLQGAPLEPQGRVHRVDLLLLLLLIIIIIIIVMSIIILVLVLLRRPALAGGS